MARHANNRRGASRSTDPGDYQDLPQPIGAMAKHFADGHEIPLHSHARDQLLHAARGVMRLRTERETWIVPPASAVYLPAGLPHAVAMHGAVEMRTLYIDTAAASAIGAATPSRPRVVAVTPLLRELILALCDEPVDYTADSRGGLIARLIDGEIARARELETGVPLPRDPRLQRLCAGLLADPADRRTLEDWSAAVGASSRTLARLFRQDLGMGFTAWRQRVRFHQALEALSAGETVARVADRHGYASASAFTAAFVRVMGMPPSRAAGPADAAG